jgi:hypothetical protein
VRPLLATFGAHLQWVGRRSGEVHRRGPHSPPQPKPISSSTKELDQARRQGERLCPPRLQLQTGHPRRLTSHLPGETLLLTVLVRAEIDRALPGAREAYQRHGEIAEQVLRRRGVDPDRPTTKRRAATPARCSTPPITCTVTTPHDRPGAVAGFHRAGRWTSPPQRDQQSTRRDRLQ